MSLDVEHIYKQVSDAGEDWADKKSAFETLDDNTKSVLADITGDFMELKISRAEAEMRAYASARYKQHVADISAARRAWLRAQVAYDSLKMLSELRRSQESTRREEMKIR